MIWHIRISSPDIATRKALGTISLPFIAAPFSLRYFVIFKFLPLFDANNGLQVDGSIMLPLSMSTLALSISSFLSDNTYKGVWPLIFVQLGSALYFNSNFNKFTLFNAKNKEVGYIGIKVFISGFAEYSSK